MKSNLILVILTVCVHLAAVTTPAADTAPGEKDSEPHHTRKPVPSPEEIAKLPKDGGPEYNRLVFEKSPYLLQHAGNPVDWWPWGDAAFEQARKEDKPVFLSIGYTTCHWCHVMEHESFEDEEIAAMMNEHFIPVKVDREERPDIDEVYMTFTQALTGGGGWPMTVILTPDKKPFFAGTYFPRDTIGSRPGMTKLIPHISDLWQDQREAILRDADQFSEKLKEMVGGSPGDSLTPAVLDLAYEQLEKRYDPEHGGFASAPKFPVPPNLMFLLRYWKRTGEPKALEMVEKTLTEMRQGGIWDHVGYGIHRYSTDRVWLLPHFEKMLYDQALVALANLETYQATGDEHYAETAREILSYVLRDMTSETGGFYSAEDADSEGEEGKFYVWSLEEVKAVLGEEDGTWFGRTFNFAEGGNFTDEATGQLTGENIPHLKDDLSAEDFERFEKLRATLFQHREKRIHPQKDDKILTDWNGLMIAAFAKAGQILGDEIYGDAARNAADFVLENLMTDDGRLLKRYRQGESGLTAHLEDYAFLVWGLLDLYETTFELEYLEQANRLTHSQIEHFWDETEGGFFMTADDAEKLLVRSKKIYGGAIPSGNAVSLLNLNRLYRITTNGKFEQHADELVKAFSGELERAPSGFPLVMCGLDFFFGPSQEIVIAGEPDAKDTAAMLAAVRKPFLPNKVVVLRPPGNAEKLSVMAPYTETQVRQGGKATAYVCEHFVCNLPTTDLGKMKDLLSKPKPE